MVTVYSRQGCHLCENAVNSLKEMQAELDFEIEIIDIGSDPELERLYGEMIPVIHIDGVHHDYGRVIPDRFRSSLERHRQSQ